MARSPSSLPLRLTKVDTLAPDHWYLAEADMCFFLGEYTTGGGYQFSPTNQLILNLKKSVDRRGRREWHHKERAIQEVAAALRAALQELLDRITFVPIPPSKAKDHPLYDDRMTQVCKAVRPRPPADVRELIVQRVSTPAAHESPIRPTPQDIAALYEVDIPLAHSPPGDVICIVDDVLTTGAHFVAAQSLLKRQFPATPVIGVFVARRVSPER